MAVGDACPYAVDYERLRSQIVGPAPPGAVRGVGLALLLRDGVTAWMRAVQMTAGAASHVTVTRSPSADGERRTTVLTVGSGRCVEVIPPTHHAEAARLLAGLVLSARVGHRLALSPGASA